jgi:hypothetical protein
VDGAGRLFDPRPERLRRTGREASGQQVEGARAFFLGHKIFIPWGKGAKYNYNFSAVPLPAPKAPFVRRAPPIRSPQARATRPDLERGNGPETTRRTGGPGPGRDFKKLYA